MTEEMKIGVVQLQASATREVDNDMIIVTFGVTKEGEDSALVQEDLKKALAAAVAAAKTAQATNKAPGAIEIETGGFSVGPRYGVVKKATVINGYVGQTSLIIKGTDTEKISKLAGDITVMTVTSVGHAVSKNLRDSLEKLLTSEAVKNFRQKAADAVEMFEAKTYVLDSVSISVQRNYNGGVRAMSASMDLAGSAPLPMETGKTQVGVDVNGSIMLDYVQR